MSSRLRSLDSKISFFAFADIITAVSGVLIFVALLLATDLGVPTTGQVQSANPDLERQIQEILAQQVEVDAQNEHLQELLATANTAPDADKLQADIRRLQVELAEEQKRQTALLQQMSQSRAAMAKRDAELGLTGLKTRIDQERETARAAETKEADVQAGIAVLDQHLAGLQSQLVQLRQREGKLWLIPERETMTKEPILAIVSRQGISLERFGHPEKTRQIENTTARSNFRDYLRTLKSGDEYVVFLIRPSGISLFQDLVTMTRAQNIEVGYDAIEEDKEIYFVPPPVLDTTTPGNLPPGYASGNGGYSGSTNAGNVPWPPGNAGSGQGSFDSTGGGEAGAGNGTGNATGGRTNGTGKETARVAGQGSGNAEAGKPATGAGNNDAATVKTNAPPPASTPVTKSWWQRFVEWVGSFFK